MRNQEQKSRCPSARDENDSSNEPIFEIEDYRTKEDTVPPLEDRIGDALDEINRKYAQTLQRLA